MSFDKLPEVIIELVAIYLIPSRHCRLEGIDTQDIDNFCASARITNTTIRNSKLCRPPWHKCPTPVRLLGKSSCSEHTSHFETKQRIHKTLTSHMRSRCAFIHFESKEDALFARRYIEQFIGHSCCGGKGYQWNRVAFART
jgi:hypothetical protein